MKMKEFTDTELANEQWRDIDGYDGMYQVSDLGRVRSLKFGKVMVLRPVKDKDGYLQLNLYRDGKKKYCRVHRLVASAFIPNDNIFNTEINHRNECKSDNRVDNLEWCDSKYNKRFNGLHHRRKHPKYKRNAIKDLYDPNLTWYENIELFKANGIECSRQTLINLRKDLGLTRKYTKRS